MPRTTNAVYNKTKSSCANSNPWYAGNPWCKLKEIEDQLKISSKDDAGSVAG
jgi:hypothetical protein